MAIPPAAVRYDGAAFAAGEPVRAKFRVLDTGLSLLARLSDEPDRRIQVESGFRYLNFQSNLRSASADKEDALDAFFPLVGIILDQRLHPDGAWLRLEARAGGFTWSRDAVQLRSALLDATLAFEFELLPTLRAAFGARVESVDYRYALDGEAKEIRYVLAGPFLGIALRL